MQLANRTALISGGSRGIGKEIALEFAKAGADIVIMYKSDDASAHQLTREIENMGRRAIALKTDVSNFQDVQDKKQDVMNVFSKVDILVNNAGILRDRLFTKMEDSHWHQVIDINLTGVYNCTRTFLDMIYESDHGCIINIASIAGIHGNVGQTNYSASKAGIIGFTKALCKEAAHHSVRVNCIAPGFIKTGIWDDIPPKVYETALKKIALRKIGMPEHVSKTALFLASDTSSYMTGQVIEVDGGIGLSVI